MVPHSRLVLISILCFGTLVNFNIRLLKMGMLRIKEKWELGNG